MTKDYLRLYRAMIAKTARRGVDAAALAAGSAASHDLIKDPVSLSHELCTDQV